MDFIRKVTILNKRVENNISDLAAKHYENFPVSSFLIPEQLKQDVAIVYWFARTADDFADEGSESDEKRLENLFKFEKELSLSLEGKSADEYFIKLNETKKKYSLKKEYFFDLLSAFKQDVIKKRYQNYDELKDYCRRSANPIGRIILDLFKIKNDEATKYSDMICTALQLTNFYQDTAIDFYKGRIYYPAEEMKRFGVTEKMFELNEFNSNVKSLVQYNIERTQSLFDEGKNLLNYLDGRLKLEIKWTIAGGEKILHKIRKNDFNVFFERPILSKFDYIFILLRSIFSNA